MFVQVIQARTKDADALRKHMEKWQQELRPTAEGYLGSTAGVADDGTFIAAARFESQDAAKKNSDRPEQGAWWKETEKLLDGDAQFYDCTEVHSFLAGGSDDAGFVQVIQGFAKDKEAIMAGDKRMEESLPKERPDVMGGFTAWGPDDGFSQFVYFTSEAEARKGESRERSPEAEKEMEEWQNLVKDMKFIDLKQPWLFS